MVNPEDRNMVPKYAAKRKATFITTASIGFNVTKAQIQFNRYDNLHKG